METKATYIASGDPLTKVRGTGATQLYTSPAFEQPTPDQVDALIKGMGWSQNDVAKLVGVAYNPKKGSTTVRKWRASTDSPEHRAIPYAAWRLMLLEAGLAE